MKYMELDYFENWVMRGTACCRVFVTMTGSICKAVVGLEQTPIFNTHTKPKLFCVPHIFLHVFEWEKFPFQTVLGFHFQRRETPFSSSYTNYF